MIEGRIIPRAKIRKLGLQTDIALECSLCYAFAVVELTTEQLAQQPDDTTHVCHPMLGGCNHGFAVEGN